MSNKRIIRPVKIEFVCIANNARSVISEVKAIHRVEELGLENKINISSSGTHAKLIDGDILEYPIETTLRNIETCLKRGVYDDPIGGLAGEKAKKYAKEIIAHKKKILSEVNNGNKEIKRQVEMCIRYLIINESVKRNLVLLEAGMIPRERYQNQTIVKDNIDLVLVMKKDIAGSVKEIYDGVVIQPRIIPICEYVGVKEDVIDIFGGLLPHYRKMRDVIFDITEKALDKVIKEYKII